MWRFRRIRPAFAWGLGVLALVLTGCVAPTPAPAPGPVIVQREYVALPPPTVARLEIPTLTPAPTPTSFFPAPTNPPVTAAFQPTPPPRTLVPVAEAADCVDRFRQLLVAYDGPAIFAAEVAIDLSHQLLAQRPDCGLSEWEPSFSLERSCEGEAVGGLALPDGLVRLAGNFSQREASVTRRDAEGNLLLHFERMPYEDLAGCWFYSAGPRVWAWATDDGEFGADRVVHVGCDQELQLRLVELDFVAGLEVARAIMSIQADFPESCPADSWRQYPQLRSHPHCDYQSDTGTFNDGSFLVNWNPNYLPGDGAVCWLWNPETSEWEFSYVDEEEEDGVVPSPLTGEG